jgi:hypothetical protein
VAAGTYSEAQVDLVKPVTPALGGAADNTIQITGKYNGASFTIAFPAFGTYHQVLSPPVTVSDNAGATVSATISLPVGAWFTGANGSALDPANPAQLAQIQANVRAYFPVEADDHKD